MNEKIILLVLGAVILFSGCLELPTKVEPVTIVTPVPITTVPEVTPFAEVGHFLYVQKLGYEPERYVEITAEEFENFPLLKEAINKCALDRDNRCSLEGEYLRASEKLTFPILDFMIEKQEKKYSKRIIVDRMPCQTFCVNETEFNLEEFPAIKKAVGELGRIIEVPPNEWRVFRDLMESRLKEKLGEKYPFTTFEVVFIEVENGYYLVEPYGLYADLNLKVRGEYYAVTNIWLDPIPPKIPTYKDFKEWIDTETDFDQLVVLRDAILLSEVLTPDEKKELVERVNLRIRGYPT